MTLVLDASVVAKCLVPEADSDKSQALLTSWAKGAVDVAAPEILALEIASMLWKRATRGLMSAARATFLYEEFMALRIPLEPMGRLLPGALQVAMRLGRSVYDSLYVSMAVEMNWGLVTADEKLFNAVRSSVPGVRLLRDWV